MRETETPVLEATNKILCSPRPIGEEQWPRSRLNQNYLMVLEGLVGWWGLTAGTGALEGSPLASTLLEFTSNPTIGPIDPRTGLPQAEQLPGRECSPTHRQICGLKLYWARPYPQEQDPVFPITSLSHQEAYTSLLALSIRGQTEEAWSTVSQQLKQKPYYRKLITMKKMKVMSQMKGQDKNQVKQLNEEIGRAHVWTPVT